MKDLLSPKPKHIVKPSKIFNCNQLENTTLSFEDDSRDDDSSATTPKTGII